MKTLVFFQEPDFEVENYIKREYVLLDGDFTSEKDILCEFMKKFRMDTEFWYKLKLIPLEMIPTMYIYFGLDPNEQYCAYILDRSDRTADVKQTLYRLNEVKRLKEYITKTGEVVPIPEHIEYIPMDERTVFVKIKNLSVEEAINFISDLKQMTGLNLFYVSENVEFMRLEEVEEFSVAD